VKGRFPTHGFAGVSNEVFVLNLINGNKAIIMKHQKITSTVRAGVDTDGQYGAVMPPVYLSSNFSFDGYEGKREYDYSRSGNPTRDVLADAITKLEGGHGAVITNTGMSAVVLVTHLLGVEDTIIAPHNCYGGCYRAFSSLSDAGRFKTKFVDFTNTDSVRRACIQHLPKIIWVETPSNPLLRITDIRAMASIARECGALLVVDNTFLTPLLQQPLSLGADIVVHSTTKYINGHSDVVGGAVVARTPALLEELAWWANCVGSTASPWDCSQTMRGLRTLHARMRCHEENAQLIARVLDTHTAVKQVHYPGLDKHPEHHLACAQQSGFGAIISFELQGGEPEVRTFLDELSLFTLAESLGGVESLVCHPGSMTHAAMSEEAQLEAGIGTSLLRLSVGIEYAPDLVSDLSSALDHVQKTMELPLNVVRYA
jgi:cystathionine gamma-synthase